MSGAFTFHLPAITQALEHRNHPAYRRYANDKPDDTTTHPAAALLLENLDASPVVHSAVAAINNRC